MELNLQFTAALCLTIRSTDVPNAVPRAEQMMQFVGEIKMGQMVT